MNPGAHDNLVEGRTADRMAEQTGQPSNLPGKVSAVAAVFLRWATSVPHADHTSMIVGFPLPLILTMVEDEEMRFLYEKVNMAAETRSDADARENALYQDNMLAKRRWRPYASKPPRRFRKSNWRPRNVAPLQSGPLRNTYAWFLPKGAGKSGFPKRCNCPRKNPRRRNGEVLRCNKCGSDVPSCNEEGSRNG